MPTAATTVASSSKREDEDNDDDSDDGVTERAFREVCFCSSLLRLLFSCVGRVVDIFSSNGVSFLSLSLETD